MTAAARCAGARSPTIAACQGPVAPLYIVEPGLWEQADASGRQWAFLHENLVSLREQLAKIGQSPGLEQFSHARLARQAAVRA